MRAERPRGHGGVPRVALLLLLAGCASRPLRPGDGGAWALGPRMAPEGALHLDAGGTPPGLKAEAASAPAGAAARLLRHHAELDVKGRGAHALSAATEAGPLTPCGQPPPPGWPHLDSSTELLAPFLACATPAGFVALQRTVDMARVLEALSDWDAVRLGALGPLVTAEAAGALGRKRADFLVQATEAYGAERAEVFALFILHAAFDDEARQWVALLAADKQLDETLGSMPAVRLELQRRGVALEDFAPRGERASDVLRGLGRAGRDALATSPTVGEARYADLMARRAQLPPPYREALDAVERELMRRHYAPGSVALGAFDSLTFGVPLGCYHLAAGTAGGVAALAQGQYERATRQLAPAALLVGLYATGRGARAAAESPGGASGGARLGAVVEGLRTRLGESAVGELARHLQAQREAALLVAEGGAAAAAALHEARGNVAGAWWCKPPPRPRGGAPRGGGGGGGGGTLAAAVREAAGFTREALEARWREAELEAPGPRLPADVTLLETQVPRLEAPPPGVHAASALWGEYVAYRQRRLGELRAGETARGPLLWEAYEVRRGQYARGLAFEQDMVARLREDAARPQAQRQWLGDFKQPRVEVHVGVTKAGAEGVRYVDVLVLEERPPAWQTPRVETFSFKSRDFSSLLDEKVLTAQMTADARAALRYYGETLNIRRPALRLRDVQVPVQQVRLIYEGGRLLPQEKGLLEKAMTDTQIEVRGVEVSFQ
jgi:hypothetical protein